MPVAYRPGTAADAEAIHRVTKRAIQTLTTGAYNDAQREAWATNFDPETYPLEGTACWTVVAEHTRSDGGTGEIQLSAGSSDDAQVDPRLGAEIVGYGILDTDPEQAAFEQPVAGEVFAVYVHPAVGRSGIGSTLYTKLEDYAREQGLDLLGLWASLNAVGFYERHGYRRVADRTLSLNDVELPVVEMVCRLE